MGFDLTKNNLSEKAELGYTFELLIPEVQEKTGAFITVRGVQSPKVKAHSRRVFAQIQQKEQVAKKRGKEVEPMTLDDAEDMAIDAAFVRMIGWKGVEENGKALEFNEENVKRVLREHSWIREQVLAESDQLTNFI